ncbi:hypothetical protein T4C_2476 [Trichinella pseudospiralis]|uniref:Uncharacterized protein n=1 Tax=Trichinella pseudospiralis TaxID=6337 RepID=A0A0V1JP25_TRIPS|nr:hypothetical protein T4C_2476 [Trichinella pseudospiralis]
MIKFMCQRRSDSFTTIPSQLFSDVLFDPFHRSLQSAKIIAFLVIVTVVVTLGILFHPTEATYYENNAGNCTANAQPKRIHEYNIPGHQRDSADEILFHFAVENCLICDRVDVQLVPFDQNVHVLQASLYRLHVLVEPLDDMPAGSGFVVATVEYQIVHRFEFDRHFFENENLLVLERKFTKRTIGLVGPFRFSLCRRFSLHACCVDGLLYRFFTASLVVGRILLTFNQIQLANFAVLRLDMSIPISTVDLFTKHCRRARNATFTELYRREEIIQLFHAGSAGSAATTAPRTPVDKFFQIQPDCFSFFRRVFSGEIGRVHSIELIGLTVGQSVPAAHVAGYFERLIAVEDPFQKWSKTVLDGIRAYSRHIFTPFLGKKKSNLGDLSCVNTASSNFLKDSRPFNQNGRTCIETPDGYRLEITSVASSNSTSEFTLTKALVRRTNFNFTLTFITCGK